MVDTALRPLPTARRPFSALVISPDEHRRAEYSAVVDRAGARHVFAAGSGSEARTGAQLDTSNDVCLLDGSITDTPVLPLVRQLHGHGWRRVVLVTARDDSTGVRAAMHTGIRGYVVISLAAQAETSSNAVLAQLTEREIEVLQAVSEGMSNKAIGAYLGLSALTVKSHMARIARKLGTGDRAALVAIALRAGLID